MAVTKPRAHRWRTRPHEPRPVPFAAIAVYADPNYGTDQAVADCELEKRLNMTGKRVNLIRTRYGGMITVGEADWYATQLGVWLGQVWDQYDNWQPDIEQSQQPI